MSADQRTRVVTLGVLMAVLVAVLAYQFWPAARDGGPAAPGARPAGQAAPSALDPKALDIHLDALEAAGPRPDVTRRDPFSFRPVAPPPVAVARPETRPVAPDPTTGPAGTIEPPPPPPPPPITLKFIGLIVDGGTTGRIAVLSDGRFVFHGREGDIIEGRYRVVRIGDESLQMEHVDGRGRQTIRLSGS